MTYTIDQIRRALVDVAEREWSYPVKDFDPGQTATPDLIQRYWEETGWSWFLEAHTPDGMYCERWREHPWQSFCGLFVAFCGLRVGDMLEDDRCVDVALKRPVASKVLPSTKRLARPRHWYSDCPAFEHPGMQQLKAGDVITVGDGKDGSHIALVRRDRVVGEQYVYTVEGNATGELGDGTTGEGVIHRRRSFGEIKRTFRFTLDHFEGSAL